MPEVRLMTAAALVDRAWTTFRIVWAAPFAVRMRGIVQAVIAALVLVAMASWNAADPSWNTASAQPVKNWLGGGGAVLSDILLQSLGIGAWLGVLLFGAFGVGIALGDSVPHRLHPTRMRIFAAVSGVLLASSALSSLAAPGVWPLAAGMGGIWGDGLIGLTSKGLSAIHVPYARLILGAVFGVLALWALGFTLGLRLRDVYDTAGWAAEKGATVRVARPEKAAKAGRGAKPAKAQQAPRKPRHVLPEQFDDEPEAAVAAPSGREPPHPPISIAPTSGSRTIVLMMLRALFALSRSVPEMNTEPSSSMSILTSHSAQIFWMTLPCLPITSPILSGSILVLSILGAYLESSFLGSGITGRITSSMILQRAL